MLMSNLQKGVACYGGEFMQLSWDVCGWCGVVWFGLRLGLGFGCCHPRVSQVGVVEWALPISPRWGA